MKPNRKLSPPESTGTELVTQLYQRRSMSIARTLSAVQYAPLQDVAGKHKLASRRPHEVPGTMLAINRASVPSEMVAGRNSLQVARDNSCTQHVVAELWKRHTDRVVSQRLAAIEDRVNRLEQMLRAVA